MPIKVAANQVFETTAEVNLNAFKATFGLKCRLVDREELGELREQWTGIPPAGTASSTPASIGVDPAASAPVLLTDREFIDKWLVGFADDVLGDDDKPLPFTSDNVTKLLKMPGVNMAVLAAFFKGYEEAETKNSKLPHAG